MSYARVRAQLFVLAALSSVPAAAQCFEWDARFGFPNGTNDEVRALLVHDDGGGPALFVGGSFFVAGDANANGIAKWNGAHWSALGQGLTDNVRALAVFDDGSGPKLYAGGSFTYAGGAPANFVARWDGAGWTSLGSGVGSVVYALAVFDEDGAGPQAPALFAGGVFTSAGGASAYHVARWNGASWSPVGAGLGGPTIGPAVYALIVHDDGSGPALYAGGDFGGNLARWNGAAWSSVGGPIGQNGVRALAEHDDGSGLALYAAGSFANAAGVPATNIARWNGANWSAVGGGIGSAASYVDSLQVWNDGTGAKLFAGGSFGSPGSNVARWTGSSWTALAGGADAPVHALAEFGANLYAGGEFLAASGAATQHIAAWDATNWTPLAPVGLGLDGTPVALVTFDDGSGNALYAGGRFAQALGLARWNGAAWTPLASGLVSPFDYVNALAVYDDGSGLALYAGGFFSSVGGVPAANIARWNGTSWSALGSGLDSSVSALAVYDDGSGAALYAAGDFTFAGGASANRVAKWNGSVWTALGSGLTLHFPCSARSLTVWNDGTGDALYVGGSFGDAGGVTVRNIARWNGSSWSALGAGVDSFVIALAGHDDGSGSALYAGGGFNSAGGAAATGIARWSSGSWSPVGGGMGAIGTTVNALAEFDDGGGQKLYAGGTFTLAGGNPASHIAQWNGSSWSALGSGVDGSVFALATFDSGLGGGTNLYAAGGFVSAGGHPAYGFAEWHGCLATTPFCFGDGLAANCPCNNSGLPGNGCQNSAATGGARITAAGTTSPDTVVLTSSGELPSASSIFLQGSAAIAPLPFGDGLRCAGGALKRMYVKSAVAGSVSAPGVGDPSITSRSAILGDPIAPGSFRVYQTYYRDPVAGFCPTPAGNGWNVSNGVRIDW